MSNPERILYGFSLWIAFTKTIAILAAFCGVDSWAGMKSSNHSKILWGDANANPTHARIRVLEVLSVKQLGKDRYSQNLVFSISG